MDLESLQGQESTQLPQGDDMDATLRETYRATLEGTSNETPVETPVDQPGDAGQSGQARDEHGRFVKVEATENADQGAADTTLDGESGGAGDTDESGSEATVHTEPGPYDKPPSTWRKEATEGWDQLPANVRQEVHRREQNMLDGLRQYKEAADFGTSIYREIQPYEPMLRSLNAQPQDAIRYMLNNEYLLRTGTPEQKGQVIADAIKMYGIDPSQVRLEQGETQENVTPEIRELRERLDAMQRAEQERERAAREQAQQAQAAQQQEIQTEVENFRLALDDKGNLKYPHFEKVKGHMSALLGNGLANGLEDAYEQATWANPEVKAIRIAEQQRVAREAAAKRAAEARKAAAVNVQSEGTLPGKQPTGTMEEDIRATYRRLTGNAG